MSNILVTGGLGYIGSHTVLELLGHGHNVVIADNLSNSKKSVIERLKQITNKDIPFYNLDVSDRKSLERIFADNKFDAVMHFAGLKSVGESIAQPLEYYQNNLDSSLTLCSVMREYGIRKLLFSSSATVYGNPSELPLRETSQVGVGITNPYGQTKFMIEQILQDLCISDDSWQISSLRYFNPIGAHESGLIGEDPNGLPNNLMPFISKVAVGELPALAIFGDDYDTPDGTCIRDYIHVVDLARGHIAALEHLSTGYEVFNLGSGKGVSVLEAIKAFEAACGHDVPSVIKPRRPGDIAACYGDPSKANQVLNWKVEKSLAGACADAWRWQQYAKSEKL